ncbi:hypothetical protein HMPREF0645_1243 [Hallella bergensis DSM 17361]|uniref:Uncharacterized protein n=1 Tax=Hallella bergensis DSM 17361 TaxID=585502 RepID=D1PWA8_9BACT|nr:hypothetical protein HMPREF0645_1243 [Hallella bergensis DSM 17361]
MPISRDDAIEASTFQGVRFGEISSMFSICLQSYGGFLNISLSAIITLFHYLSLYFYDIKISIEKAFILQIKRTEYRSIKLLKERYDELYFNSSIYRQIELSRCRQIDKSNDR